MYRPSWCISCLWPLRDTELLSARAVWWRRSGLASPAAGPGIKELEGTLGPLNLWYQPMLILRGVWWSVLEHKIVEGRHGLHLCLLCRVGIFGLHFPPFLESVEKEFALDVNVELVRPRSRTNQADGARKRCAPPNIHAKVSTRMVTKNRFFGILKVPCENGYLWHAWQRNTDWVCHSL